LKLFVPFIAWEERRTQLLEEAFDKIRKAREAFESLSTRHPRDLILSGLPAPALIVWKDDDVTERSKEVMRKFAEDHKIEVVRLAPDHADRAWERYFNVGHPFNPKEERENRRKDIPDSWILECALDLKVKHDALCAICGDGRLAGALEMNGIHVYRVTHAKNARDITREILSEIESELAPDSHVNRLPTTEAPVGDASDGSAALAQALREVQSGFDQLSAKVLGYVGYFREITKDQLFELLARSGASPDKARNAADRLALSGILLDTGNYYLPVQKEAALEAAALVEEEIIRLLAS
jgi:hypothetical protein